MRVVTFGEIMLKLQPEGYLRFFQNDKMLATFGGAEANVAVSLANFGLDSRYVTKLPEGPIGQGAVNALRYFGVDVSKIARGGERIGIYFAEKARHSVGASAFTTGTIRRSRRLRPEISTGMTFLMAPTGSTTPALRPRLERTFTKFFFRPSKRQRKRESP